MKKMETLSKIPVTDSIYLKVNEVYCRYMYNEILYIEASGSYCYIHLSNNSKILLTTSLAELQDHLPIEIFIRTHRSFIVNINYIERILGNLIYIGEMAIPIGRENKKEIFSRLNIVGL